MFESCGKGRGVVWLLHCLAGINRSATVAMAVLMQVEGWTLQEAYAHTRRRRGCVAPVAGNKRLIAEWEREKFGKSSMEEWLLQCTDRVVLPTLLASDGDA